MAVTIGTNIFALQAQRSLSSATERISTTFERLSSGQRINRASDDAAGLAIAGKLNTDSRIYTQAVRNVNDGLSYLNIADGALSELSSITCRQRELAEQAANGVYTYTQRNAITAEANALAKEFNRIVKSTEFNGRRILDVETSGGNLRIQSGYGLDGSLSFEVGGELARTVGTGTFAGRASYAAALKFALTMGDLDGDGTLDMVTAGYAGASGGAMVWFNDGHGSFGNAATYATETGWSNAAAVADINGDGALDLVTAGSSGAGAGRATVQLNTGNGTFVLEEVYATESTISYALSLADVNGDGAPDMVTAGSGAGGGRATIKLNDGYGNFGTAVSYTTENTYSRALFLADINGDQALDLLTAGTSGANGSATVRINDGHGNFSAAVSYGAESGGSRALSVADINGDGCADLVTAGGDYATVRLNGGNGSFGAASSYGYAAAGNRALSITDLNGDGAPDLVTAGAGGPFGCATVRLNNGSGTFGGSVSYSTPDDDSYAGSVGDVNGDGAPDLITCGDGGAAVRTAIAHDVTTIAAMDLFSQASARQALTTLQDQLDRISSERGLIGSSQRRLAVALNTLSVSRENANAAAARITDADTAQESAELVRNQLLQQTAVAVLTQASRQPSLALTLLR